MIPANFVILTWVVLIIAIGFLIRRAWKAGAKVEMVMGEMTWEEFQEAKWDGWRIDRIQKEIDKILTPRVLQEGCLEMELADLVRIRKGDDIREIVDNYFGEVRKGDTLPAQVNGQHVIWKVLDINRDMLQLGSMCEGYWCKMSRDSWKVEKEKMGAI